VQRGRGLALSQQPSARLALIAAGAPEHVGSRNVRAGAVLLLGIEPKGTVGWEALVSEGQGGLPSGVLQSGSHFGSSVLLVEEKGAVGTMRATIVLAVGAPGYDSDDGAVFVLHLDAASLSVLSHAVIYRESPSMAAATGAMIPRKAAFGISLALLGDLNEDGFIDIAIGRDKTPPKQQIAGRALNLREGTIDGDSNPPNNLPASPSPSPSPFAHADSAVMLAMMDFRGSDYNVSVKQLRSISSLDTSWLPQRIDSAGSFGASIAGLGDWNSDGTAELLVGEPRMGRVHLLSLQQGLYAGPSSTPVASPTVVPSPSPSSCVRPTPLGAAAARNPRNDGSSQCPVAVGGSVGNSIRLAIT